MKSASVILIAREPAPLIQQPSHVIKMKLDRPAPNLTFFESG